MSETSFESKISQLSQRIVDLGKVVTDLKGRRSALAPSAVEGDTQARAELQQIDAAHTHAEQESGLIRDAIDQLKKLAAQHKANAAAKEQQKRVDAAQKVGAQILALDEQIDTALAQLCDRLAQRRAKASELGKLHFAEHHLVMRLHQRYGATHAAAYHGLRDYIGIEHVEPHHRRSLSQSDAWLRQIGAYKQQQSGNSHGQTETQERRHDDE
jgi:chromosome segregation ATPase